MRTPRKHTLPAGPSDHFLWRCINGEFMLRDETHILQVGKFLPSGCIVRSLNA
mgnify:CR=1 FL=1